MDWSLWFGLWFSRTPAQVPSVLATVFSVLVILLCVAGFGLRIWSERKREMLSKEERRFWRLVAVRSLTFAVLGSTLLLLSYQQIWFLGARFWYLIWGVCFVWVGCSLWRMRRALPLLLKARQEKAELQKYLP